MKTVILTLALSASSWAASWPKITAATPPSGTMAVPYSFAFQATGGRTPYTWTIAYGALPAGLSLSGSGVISGVTAQYTRTAIQVRVTDKTQRSVVSDQFTLLIDYMPIKILTTRCASSPCQIEVTGGPPGGYNCTATGIPATHEITPDCIVRLKVTQ